MTLIHHELRQNKIALLIWTASIGFLFVICISLFPEMKIQMEEVNDIFASMGSFTVAFGMDRLNFGTLIGFYSVECGNILGLGGAFFAALSGAGILSKEEKDGTAEFLLAHPISRSRIVTEKLIAVLLQVLVMNLMIYLLSVGAIAAIGEEIPYKEIHLIHLAYLLMQMEMAGICFGLSAFLRRGSLGMGLGLAAMMYFLNIVGNITEDAGFLKYLTPFGYTEAADIVTNGCLDVPMVLWGMGMGLVGIAVAYVKYCRKDIH